MSLTTYFQFTHTSYLPLPPVKLPNTQSDSPLVKPESSEQITKRGIKTAMRMLHQPELMIMLNPLVQHYSRIPHADPNMQDRLVNLERLASEFNVHTSIPHSCSDFTDSKAGEFVHYEIVDKFVMLGGLTSKLMTYRACFRPLYDMSPNAPPIASGKPSIGLETISDPGSGVALLGKWSISEDDRKPGFLVLTEQVQVHCNVFMGWYVRGQLETAHEQLHKEFGRFFCERMVAEDPMKGHFAKSGKTWKENEAHMRREELQRTTSGGTLVSRVGTNDSKDQVQPGLGQSDTW